MAIQPTNTYGATFRNITEVSIPFVETSHILNDYFDGLRMNPDMALSAVVDGKTINFTKVLSFDSFTDPGHFAININHKLYNTMVLSTDGFNIMRMTARENELIFEQFHEKLQAIGIENIDEEEPNSIFTTYWETFSPPSYPTLKTTKSFHPWLAFLLFIGIPSSLITITYLDADKNIQQVTLDTALNSIYKILLPLDTYAEPLTQFFKDISINQYKTEGLDVNSNLQISLNDGSVLNVHPHLELVYGFNRYYLNVDGGICKRYWINHPITNETIIEFEMSEFGRKLYITMNPNFVITSIRVPVANGRSYEVQSAIQFSDEDYRVAVPIERNYMLSLILSMVETPDFSITFS